ncbi:MAG: hypothetical protein AAB214_09195 [Fibrobacterota bacterium]
MKHAALFGILAGLVVPALVSGADLGGISPFSPSTNSGAARKLAVVPEIFETAHFAIAYTTSGVHAVNQAGLGLNANGVPVVIDSLGKLAEQVWRLAIDTLEYPAPVPMDSAMAFGVKTRPGKFTIEVMDLETLQQGLAEGGLGYATYPESDPAGLKRQEVLLENDFVESSTTKSLRVIVDPINNHGDSVLYDYSKDPLKGWAVAFSHVFYHTLQYHWRHQPLLAFHEMTATWFPTRAFPSIHHEWQYLQRFVNHSIHPVFRSDSTYPNDNFPFVTALTRVFGDRVLKNFWPDQASKFTEGEPIWYHGALRRLDLDESLSNKEYLRSLLELFANIPNELNQHGVFMIRPRSIKAWPIATDSTSNATISSATWYGVELIALNKDQFTNGWNVMLIDGVDSSRSVGGLISLPSGTIHVDFPGGTNRHVYGRELGDTAVVVAVLPSVLGKYSWSAKFRFTTSAPTTALYRKANSQARSYKLCVDLHGRPVTSSTRGIVLEGDAQSGWRRRVLVGN